MAVRFPEPILPVDPVELEIHQLFDHLIVCLNQRRVALLTTYRDTRAQIAARPIARARKEQELITCKIQTEQSLQMNELRETQERILAEIEQTLAEVRVPQPETRAVFRGNCGYLEQVIAGVGEVVEEEVPVIVQEVPIIVQEVPVIVQEVPVIVQEVPVVPQYEEMRPIVAVGKRGQAPGELWNPRGIAIDENTNLIYVAEGLGSCRVSIFSETGEFINTFTHQDMRAPWGIAIHRDNLYVTDTGVHAVFQFKIEVDMRLVAKLGSEGSGMGEFNSPRGVTVSTNGDVFVADCNYHRIQILDDSLHFQREITHQRMQYPFDVKLTPDEVYVLCGNNCIFVLTYTGNMIRSFDTLPGNNFLITPFFCLDAEQNIIVGDWYNINIKIITKEGTLLHNIQQAQDSGYQKGIALTKNLKIVTVYNDAPNQLTIYSS